MPSLVASYLCRCGAKSPCYAPTQAFFCDARTSARHDLPPDVHGVQCEGAAGHTTTS